MTDATESMGATEMARTIEQIRLAAAQDPIFQIMGAYEQIAQVFEPAEQIWQEAVKYSAPVMGPIATTNWRIGNHANLG
jgi:hypothetical protein